MLDQRIVVDNWALGIVFSLHSYRHTWQAMRNAHLRSSTSGRWAAHLAAALLNLLAAARHVLLPTLHLTLKLAPLPGLLNAGRPLGLRG